MAFNYKPINNNDVFPVAKDRINEIGEELSKALDLEYLGELKGTDFNNIDREIEDSGVYYLTNTVNKPEEANHNGFCILYKRNTNYAKVKYIPFNSDKEYLRTKSANKWGDWNYNVLSTDMEKYQTYKLTNNKGQFEHNKSISTKSLTGTQDVYGTIQDPPHEDLSEGWVSYKESEDNKNSLLEFNPVNSTKTFKKIRKLPNQKQNPNLIEDALFGYYMYPHYSYNKGTYKYPWETNNEDLRDTFAISRDVTYEGNPTLRIRDNQGTYPMFRQKPLEVGKDVKSGDKLTLSAYVMTNDKNKLKENTMYLDVGKYDEYPDTSNPNIGQTHVTKEDLNNGEWKLITNTVEVPEDIKYIAPILRLSLANSGGSNDFIGYFALPKLEFGEERTPFITNSKDSRQFDEIWSQWIEYYDKKEMNYVLPINIESDNYLDYVWLPNNAADKTFGDLLGTVPKGVHTFYCNSEISGSPSTNHVRGIIIVNYTSNDPESTHKATVICADEEGREFTLHKTGTDVGRARQSMVTTTLWEGTLDFGENKTIDLKEPYNEFEYIMLSYWTVAAGHDSVKWMSVPKGSTSINMYIRDFNLANNDSSLFATFFEGYITSEGTKKLKTGMAKQLQHTGTGNANVEKYNVEGIIKVNKIIGVKSE